MIGSISGSGLKKSSKPVGFSGSGKPDHALLFIRILVSKNV